MKNYEEFKSKVAEILEYSNVDIMDDTFTISWITGGRTGGSCWDEGEPEYREISADPEPEFEYLDTILENLYPSITYLQFKKLEKECVKSEKYEQSEYYGNYYYGMNKTLDLKVLYKFLVKIENEKMYGEK